MQEDVLKKLDVPLASFFQSISSKLLVCCQSIEFLRKLNRMCELRAEILKEGEYYGFYRVLLFFVLLCRFKEALCRFKEDLISR